MSHNHPHDGRDAADIPWKEHQEFESGWWGDCANTYGEETKQITYAHRMGLKNVPNQGHWPSYDLDRKSVLDVGGGPASMLLKTTNRGTRPSCTVLDPCTYPSWVEARYGAAGLQYHPAPAETARLGEQVWDEAWIYNVLQHVQDPELIIRRVREHARVIRIFEWVNLPAHLGHPHELKILELERWLGGGGTIEKMDENGCVGTAFYGYFETWAA